MSIAHKLDVLEILIRSQHYDSFCYVKGSMCRCCNLGKKPLSERNPNSKRCIRPRNGTFLTGYLITISLHRFTLIQLNAHKLCRKHLVAHTLSGYPHSQVFGPFKCLKFTHFYSTEKKKWNSAIAISIVLSYLAFALEKCQFAVKTTVFVYQYMRLK